jgi:glycosyltransferase involved in cell wall biosynthesis
MTIHPEISLVIPAFNEASRIRPTLIAADDFLGHAKLSYEILVVDDGSTDGTAALVDRLTRRRPAIRLLRSPVNRGKGSAVRLGMRAARGAIRLMCDADGSTPAAEIPKLLNPLRLGEVDIAIGSRYLAGSAVARRQPFYRRWWSRLCNFVVRRTLVPGVVDTQCGFKAFSARAAEEIFARAQIDGWAFDLEALALAHRLGYSVREVAVWWSDDPRSRIHPLRDLVRVTRDFVRLLRTLDRSAPPRAARPT